MQADHFMIERRHFVVEFRSSGQLVPWLGPAFRGITALRYRAAVCHKPMHQWRTIWRYCRGCEHIARCGYGVAFEPWRPSDGGGGVELPRPLVISPAFPAPQRVSAGDRLALEVMAIGDQASATLPGVVESLAAAGRLDGLGPDRVRFDVAEGAGDTSRLLLLATDLPKAAAVSPTVNDVTIRLSGPLFLREQQQPGSKRQVTQPGLRHLLRASMRMAREFFGDAALCPGRGHLDLDDLAATIEPDAVDIRPFLQEKASRRSMERFALAGVVGSWHFASLPGCIVPWLQCGGLLHVGGHRIAGAGGWAVDVPGAVRAGVNS
jgi:hypothetical protein